MASGFDDVEAGGIGVKIGPPRMDSLGSVLGHYLVRQPYLVMFESVVAGSGVVSRMPDQQYPHRGGGAPLPALPPLSRERNLAIS